MVSSYSRRWLRFGLGAVIGSLLASCGLISSDVTNFDLQLPDKKFTIDAGGWEVTQSEANTYFAKMCTDTTACTSAVKTVCPMGCSGICNASQTCDLSLDISVSQPVNLVMEQPELKSLNDEPVIKVGIDSVTYDVGPNSLNVDTPEITVFVAPTTVVSSTDPAAKPIGTIAPVPAGQTLTNQQLMFTAAGRAQLVTIMSSFKTPFNVLLGASIVVHAGDPVPMGKLDAVVRIKGHAGL